MRGAGEGRPVERRPDNHLVKVQLDKGGAGEIKADARPEGLVRGQAFLGVFGRGVRWWTEVGGEKPLDGLPDLQFLGRVVLWCRRFDRLPGALLLAVLSRGRGLPMSREWVGCSGSAASSSSPFNEARPHGLVESSSCSRPLRNQVIHLGSHPIWSAERPLPTV